MNTTLVSTEARQSSGSNDADYLVHIVAVPESEPVAVQPIRVARYGTTCCLISLFATEGLA